jgi:hypothetical protein
VTATPIVTTRGTLLSIERRYPPGTSNHEVPTVEEIVLFDYSREDPVLAFRGVQLSHARVHETLVADAPECGIFVSVSGRVIVAFRNVSTDDALDGFEEHPAEWGLVRECDNRQAAEFWGAFESPNPPLFWRAWREAWRQWLVQ